MPTTRVFLDANALVPIALADLLLRLAEEGFVEPFWSQHVLDGALRAVLRQRPDLEFAKVERRFNAMRDAFPEAMIMTDDLDPEDYKSPDPEDQWVIAAAVKSPADMIITRNLADFPESTLKQYRMSVQTADQLLLSILDDSEDTVIKVFHQMRSDMDNPPLSIPEMLNNLADAGVPEFSEAVSRLTIAADLAQRAGK